MFVRAMLLSCSVWGALGAMPAFAQGSSAEAMQAFRARQTRLAELGDRSVSAKTLSDVIFAARFEVDDVGGGDEQCVQDSDEDQLPDCAETGTGVFVDETDTGTDPNQSDTDGDGLRDGDEVVGTLDGLDLPALGVNPLRKDLLVEYDWFDDAENCAAHSHAPGAAVLQRVAAVYARAPVTNPDGSTGIHVVQDAGAFGGGNRIEGHSAVLPGTFDATWAAIKQANFADARRGYFHYVLMAHRYNAGSNSSGYAEVVGDDALVTLNCLSGDEYVARTIVHELGHNLGLHHGGFEACNGKPNYNSLMNYRYQFNGLDGECRGAGDGESDGYSTGTREPIDEAQLDEAQGMCGQPSIDWNENGSMESGIALDLNPQYASVCGGQGLGQNLDFDDWANITLLGLRDAQQQLKSIKEEVGCAGAPPPSELR
jgi:hypothetical protein